ncbi:MAG: LacI family DNA-binding transcriptional regulator [Chloroflexota bacterium]
MRAEDARRSGDPKTLEAVALAAGVSRATVSRVVNGSPRVKPATRTVVERAIHRLGYTPNRAARSLVTKRTDSVGLVIPEPTSKLFGDPFFPRLIRGINSVLGEADQLLVLLTPQSAHDEEQLGNYLVSGHLDGAMLVSLHGTDPLPSFLAERGIPVVVGGRPTPGASVDFVDVDNVKGALQAVRHLIALGRRRILTVTGPLDMAAAQDRLTGYRFAISEARIDQDPSLELSGDFDQAAAREAVERFIAAGGRFDAVFAASDAMALGALAAIGRSGRRVPEDVAVVGYDDSALAISSDLSSVRQPIEEMGREMARALLAQLDKSRQVPRSIVLGTELVVRGSTGGDASVRGG